MPNTFYNCAIYSEKIEIQRENAISGKRYKFTVYLSNVGGCWARAYGQKVHNCACTGRRQNVVNILPLAAMISQSSAC